MINLSQLCLDNGGNINPLIVPADSLVHPMLIPLAQALGLSENQIDSAFIEASNI
jgi:hypothetical protein